MRYVAIDYDRRGRVLGAFGPFETRGEADAWRDSRRFPNNYILEALQDPAQAASKPAPLEHTETSR